MSQQRNPDTMPTPNPDQISDMPETCACCPPETPEAGPEAYLHERKSRPAAEQTDLIHRLNRIEGQIRGIKNMVAASAYCPDILTQVAAATAALNSFSKVLLSSHIRTCVLQDIRDGREETIDELLRTLQKLMK